MSIPASTNGPRYSTEAVSWLVLRHDTNTSELVGHIWSPMLEYFIAQDRHDNELGGYKTRAAAEARVVRAYEAKKTSA